ncbi:DUF58 domain-containing protein [Nocardioides sp.]|uniref:DUF58 domain-containing protein n=1 Tax=Nocardioides sp. TaxID=35761 RepID=UPI00286BB850|nr:DUF58 domain-containing protein [Nocardioides sp.]
MRVMQRWDAVRGVVKPLGWLVLALGVLALAAAATAGWRELTVLGVACLLLLTVSLPFLVGRTRVRVDLVLEPSRVAAGMTVAAGIDVTNLATGRMLPTVFDLPVGDAVHRYGIPALAAGATHQETFTVRTERRGVIGVGPATTRRGDPLGLVSRDTEWTDLQEILVRPAMVPLDALGAGLLRDLEGVETESISQSDLAFHTLREYVAGDDLRHVHWRSSAKAMASGGASQLLVRQYLDTRRSHATIVVDDQPASYAGGERGVDEFETAMSATASIIVRAVLDDFEASFVCGHHASSGVDGHLALDAVCRAVTGRVGLIPAARKAADIAHDTSLLFLVTGGAAPFEHVLRASAAFPPEVRRIAIVVDGSATATVTETGGLTVLRLGALADLPGLLHWSAR